MIIAVLFFIIAAGVAVAVYGAGASDNSLTAQQVREAIEGDANRGVQNARLAMDRKRGA